MQVRVHAEDSPSPRTSYLMPPDDNAVPREPFRLVNHDRRICIHPSPSAWQMRIRFATRTVTRSSRDLNDAFNVVVSLGRATLHVTLLLQSLGWVHVILSIG